MLEAHLFVGLAWLGPGSLLTFDVFAVVSTTFAQSSEVDACGTLGGSAGIDHLESFERRDQHLLLFRKKGVASDGGPEAGPDTEEGVLAKLLSGNVLEGRGSKAPQPNGGARPCRPEAQAMHPPVHLPAPARSVAPEQLQGLGEQEVEGLEGEVVEVVGPGAARLAHCRVEFLVQGAVGGVSQERHPVLIPEAWRWWGQGTPHRPPSPALLPLGVGLSPAIRVYFVGLEL